MNTESDQVIEKKNKKRKRRSKKDQEKNRILTRWSLIISIWTFFIAIGISSISDLLLSQSSLLLAFITLISIVIIGAISDTIGVAVTAVDITPFNSMASKKVYGAKKCIHITKNADKYSNFFNDVVGDVAGYIAGFAGSAIVIELVRLGDEISVYKSLIAVLVAGVSSAAIVGTKAIGKNLALTYRTEIVLVLGKSLTLLSDVLRFDFSFRKQKN